MKTIFEKIGDVLKTEVNYKNVANKLKEALNPEPYMSGWRSYRNDLHNILSELDLFELVKLGLEVRLAVLIGLDCDYYKADTFIYNVRHPKENRLPVLQTYIIASDVARTAELNYGEWPIQKASGLRRAAELQLMMDEIDLTAPMAQRQQ